MRIFILGLTLFSAHAFALKASQVDVQHVGIYGYHPAYPGLTDFRASWTVPKEPNTNHNQSIAVWIGLQSEDSKTVVQPVLTWGAWSNGVADGWNIGCWVAKVDNRDEFSHQASKTLRVYPGIRLSASVRLTGYNNGIYTYRCAFEGYPDTELTYQSREFLNTSMLEYEMQDAKTCTDYTYENANFTNVYLVSGKNRVGMKPYKAEDPKKCGMKVKFPGNNSVSIGLQ